MKKIIFKSISFAFIVCAIAFNFSIVNKKNVFGSNSIDNLIKMNIAEAEDPRCPGGTPFHCSYFEGWGNCANSMWCLQYCIGGC